MTEEELLNKIVAVTTEKGWTRLYFRWNLSYEEFWDCYHELMDKAKKDEILIKDYSTRSIISNVQTKAGKRLPEYKIPRQQFYDGLIIRTKDYIVVKRQTSRYIILSFHPETPRKLLKNLEKYLTKRKEFAKI